MPGSANPGLVHRILHLAWPVLVGQWAVMAFGVIDTIMTGHASADDLAAMALGSSVYASVLVGLVGVVTALNPIIAQHLGAGRTDEIGKSFVQGLWLALLLTLAGGAAMSFPDAWLVMSHVTPAIHDQVALYLRALVFALPAALLFRTVYAFNTAVSRPKIVMGINLVALAVKLPLNYIFIYGKFGLPALGAPGCAVATAIVMWCSCVLGFWVILSDRFYRRYSIRFAWPQLIPLRELARLGVPTGLSYIVEVTSFTFMALLVARLGANVTGGHQITANLAALCYGVPFSLSVAIGTLAAQFLGAGDAVSARQVIKTGLGLALSIAVCLSASLFFFKRQIVGLYTSEPNVARIALNLIGYLIIFHVFDALQSVAGYSLRAYKHAIAPMLIYTVSLWGVGLGGGYWLAFYPVIGGRPLGAQGLWLAAALSLALAATALLVHLRRISGQALIRTGTPRRGLSIP